MLELRAERLSELCTERDEAWELWHEYCLEWMDVFNGTE